MAPCCRPLPRADPSSPALTLADTLPLLLTSQDPVWAALLLLTPLGPPAPSAPPRTPCFAAQRLRDCVRLITFAPASPPGRPSVSDETRGLINKCSAPCEGLSVLARECLLALSSSGPPWARTGERQAHPALPARRWVLTPSRPPWTRPLRPLSFPRCPLWGGAGRQRAEDVGGDGQCGLPVS